ncbi:oxygen-dependent coproporphyrinogen oxidase [filamentous cyanobacterium CCT1]|nr:oxygen-dependent coproporphyrinogen oxidase [filamentous cyanobacterium CCT1]PSN78017.1 oxygen-dependent coproporphyrinogen oxidase [filamentous cyanobacterium CCP4]
MTTTPVSKPVTTAPPADSRDRVSAMLKQLQDSICQRLEALDGGAQFQQDAWERPEGGGGRSRVIKQGNIFEQGGVNFSEVWGDHLPPSILVQRPEAAGHRFYATGTSMVLHPRNPFIPTVHLNYRYFEAGPVWWFGGGIDLTPYYPFDEDVVHFHQTLKQTCDRHNPSYYSVFKPWCDEYFYLKHRGETRGVGGIFFDYQDGQGMLYRGPDSGKTADQTSQAVGELPQRSWDDLFNFARDCGNAFLPAYVPIVERRHNTDYSDHQRQFQLYRRGRYVEFNLVYDRGTIFGLQTNGRTESILMSLPPLVRWEYGYTPAADSPEARLYDVFLKPQDWVNWASSPAS